MYQATVGTFYTSVPGRFWHVGTSEHPAALFFLTEKPPKPFNVIVLKTKQTNKKTAIL